MAEVGTGLAARRIMVYGVTGCGKTTTAGRLSARTGVPWYAIDDHTWEVPWIPVDAAEQPRRVTGICAQDGWIIDAGYGQWLDVPLARAELIIALDYPRWRSFTQLLWRSLRNVIGKRPTCNGNVETWRLTFSRHDSILRWHFASFVRKHQRILGWMADPAVPRVIRFTHPRELDHWLESIGPLRDGAVITAHGIGRPSGCSDGRCR